MIDQRDPMERRDGRGAAERPAVHELVTGLELDGMPYAVSLPPRTPERTSSPAILFLHGGGEAGVDGIAQARVGIGPALFAAPERFPAVVIMPQTPDPFEGWSSVNLHKVLAILDRCVQAYGIDESKVTLTGVSMGGAGVWTLAALAPERFHALMPICGYGDRSEITSSLAGKPVWMFHGQEDDVVSVNESRRYLAALKACGNGGARLTELTGVGHVSWDHAYRDPAVADWLCGKLT